MPTPTPESGKRESAETVLVVEDDDGLRRLAVRILQKQGFHVLQAGTPHDAISVAGSFNGAIDLLLTDVVLPGMNGRALVERLSPTRPGMKVLFMSGYTDDTEVVQGIREQHLQFLQKPFNATDLARKVVEVLEGRRS
jgi:DNA-binding NtrC family response regulator